MTLLAIDASGPRAGIAILPEDGTGPDKFFVPTRPGLIETLPVLLQQAVVGRNIKAIAVTLGPGSFTGLRTSIALAQGYAAAAGLPLIGVTVAEAFAAAFPNLHRALWVAIRARKNRLFLLHDGQALAYADADIPRPNYPIALAGDAANEAGARLAAKGIDVMLTNARILDPLWVAQAALARLAGNLAPHKIEPLYIDPPEAKLPAAGLRPAPR